MRAKIFMTVLCTAVISQISTASAQYYEPPGGYYYYGSPAGIGGALVLRDLGWEYTRIQPVLMPE